MSHPPICPNGRGFKLHLGDWYFNLGKCGCLVELAHEDDRFNMACIAEVEWRKRAERWDACLFSYLLDGPSEMIPRDGMRARADRISEEYKRCMDNAIAWRQWGAQK